ncbi:zinc ribbon domain-containing protein [Bacillus sp. V3B]|uniref:zinc ribbon domain-containing protein n=1 Tax=Bacillus sp. V3B TaxID=2804915 RepID=UPI0021096412|nr:zinc ribbon domain-containing protein [Bacillus sp. V3B]MCQ6277098.1 zinc ribbon domain-containing protein [Bacillus sp. V3B]
MICPNCSHQNEGGKFCEKCGTPLTVEVNREAAVTFEATNTSQPQQPQQPVQPNRYIESTKRVSKMYFGYFMQVLKQPYASSQNVGTEHFINGIITMVLYAFFIPLTLYFGLKGALSSVNSFSADLFGSSTSMEVPFTDVVLKPTFTFIIFIFLIVLFTFVSIKLGRVNVSLKEVIARFGSFLIPIVAILIIGVIMSILEIKLFAAVLALGIVGSIFLVPPLVIASYKKETSDGVDVIYGSFITYLLTVIAISIMGDMLLEAFQSSFFDFFF